MNISSKNKWFMTGFIFLNMVILGLAHAVRGPVLPFIKEEYLLSYSALAFMITVCSLGLLLGVLIGGRLCERFGYKKGMISVSIFLSFSLAALSFHTSFVSLSVNFFFIYVALGFIDIALNSLGSRMFITKTAILMSLAHFFFGVGSAGGSQYAGYMLANEIPWRFIMTSIFIVYAVSMLIACFAKFPEVNIENKNAGLPFITVIKDVRVWLGFGTMGFCLVFDLGIFNWLIIYLREVQGMSPDTSASYLALYFVFFSIGRLLGGVAAEKFGYIRTFFVCIVSAVAFFVTGIVTGSALSFAIIGLFSSVFFPLFLSIVIREFKSDAPAVINVILPLNNILFMVSSVLLGVLMDYLGARIGFYTIVLFVIIAPVFLFAFKKRVMNEK